MEQPQPIQSITNGLAIAIETRAATEQVDQLRDRGTAGPGAKRMAPKGGNRARNAPRFNMLSIHQLDAPLAGHCF